MNYEELKRKAADIRDETQDAANTAERVGTVLIEIIGAAESVDNSIGEVQGAIPSSISIAEYDVSMTHEDENMLYSGAEITLENSEGKVLAKDRIYGASDQYPGLMSIRKFKQVNAHELAIATLKERNNAEIPAYSGVVDSATIKTGSTTQYSGVFYITSEGRFAAKQGNEYFANWTAYGGYQAQPVYHQDNKAVPNRLYYLTALSGGGLHYFDGTSFKVVNNNSDVEETIATLQQTILELTKRIEELEKYHATNVENGTLETAASVVDGVMSVNGSVTNEILKL